MSINISVMLSEYCTCKTLIENYFSFYIQIGFDITETAAGVPTPQPCHLLCHIRGGGS